MQKTNALMLPILSGVFAYMMPLALGLYWLIGNIIQIIQQIVVNKFCSKKQTTLIKTKKKGVSSYEKYK